MNRPSALIDGARLSKSACAPFEETLMREVVPACKSRRKISGCEFVSLGTRLVADESNATYRPSALVALEARLEFENTAPLYPFPSTPPVETLTSCIGETGGRFTVSVAGLEEMDKPS